MSSEKFSLNLPHNSQGLILGLGFALGITCTTLYRALNDRHKNNFNKSSANFEHNNAPQSMGANNQTDKSSIDLIGGMVMDVVNSTKQKKGDNSPIVIGVAGGSGSGKTTLSDIIKKAIGVENITYICHDCYYKPLDRLPVEERAKTNFDHPDALETSLLVEHIKELKKGKEVRIPEYDFSKHTRCKESTIAYPRDIILVEGILIFSEPTLVQEVDIKLYVDTESDLRFIRRLKRDVKERGRTYESVVDQYLATVRPMQLEFVEPSKRVVDMIIPDHFISRLREEI